MIVFVSFYQWTVEVFTPRCCRLWHIKTEVNKIACYPVRDWGHREPKEKLPQIRAKVNIATCQELKIKHPITKGGIFLEGFMSKCFFFPFSFFVFLNSSFCRNIGQSVCDGQVCLCCSPCLLPQLAVDVERRPHRLLKSARCASLCCAQSDEHPAYLTVCGGAA